MDKPDSGSANDSEPVAVPGSAAHVLQQRILSAVVSDPGGDSATFTADMATISGSSLCLAVVFGFAARHDFVLSFVLVFLKSSC